MVGLTGLAIAAPLHVRLQAHEAGHGAGDNPAPDGHGIAGEMHQHGSMEVPAGYPLPKVSLVIHPDARKGWNLEMQLTNFNLAPEQVNQPDAHSGDVLEGHAHLYIDDVKVTRLYGNWYYLESLPPGQHQISVSLNSNSHATLMHDGQPIQAIATLDVPAQ